MKPISITILLFLCCSILSGQTISILSWNIQDFGRTKDDTEIAYIAEIVKDYDIVCIQEVVAGDPAGAQAVGRLGELLKTMGSKWEYRISDPTSDTSPYKKERYAFLYKPSKVQLVGRPYLDKALDKLIIREPFIGQFRSGSTRQVFHVVNFHSRRFDEKPEIEIQAFQHYRDRLDSDHIIIAGDFNINENALVFDLLYNQGYQATLKNSPTTLKRKCNGLGGYLNHAIDNIYSSAGFKLHSGRRIDFVGSCGRLDEARQVSDHLPVVGVYSLQ